MKISQDTLVRQLAESTILMADMMVMLENYSAYLKGHALKGHNELYSRSIETLKENRELIEQHKSAPIPDDPPAKLTSASFCTTCGRSWAMHTGTEQCAEVAA